MCNYNIYMCYDEFQLNLHMYNCFNYNVQIYQLKFHLQYQNYTVRITQSELTYKYNYNVTKWDVEVHLQWTITNISTVVVESISVCNFTMHKSYFDFQMISSEL